MRLVFYLNLDFSQLSFWTEQPLGHSFNLSKAAGLFWEIRKSAEGLVNISFQC